MKFLGIMFRRGQIFLTMPLHCTNHCFPNIIMACSNCINIHNNIKQKLFLYLKLSWFMAWNMHMVNIHDPRWCLSYHSLVKWPLISSVGIRKWFPLVIFVLYLTHYSFSLKCQKNCPLRNIGFQKNVFLKKITKF